MPHDLENDTGFIRDPVRVFQKSVDPFLTALLYAPESGWKIFAHLKSDLCLTSMYGNPAVSQTFPSCSSPYMIRAFQLTVRVPETCCSVICRVPCRWLYDNAVPMLLH